MDIRWLLVLAAILIVLERMLYRRLVLSKVGYHRMFSEAVVTAGDTLHMVEVIENRKWLPIPWVILEATFDVSLVFQKKDDLNVRKTERFQNHRSYFAMGPYTRITRRHTVRCLRRGIYRINSAAMTCGDILGMQVMVQQWDLTGDETVLKVLPPVKPMADLAVAAHSWQGDVVVRRWILPDPFIRAGSRPYHSGDPLNQVNWKATARTGSLQVHQQEFTADYRIQVVLNFEVMDDMWDKVTEPDRVEAGIVVAASLATHFVKQGIPVGFVCNAATPDVASGGRIPPISGESQLQHLLGVMASLDVRVTVGFADLLRAEVATRSVNTDYVVITGYVNDRINEQLDSLRMLGNAVEIVPLPADAEVPALLSVSTKSEMNRHAG